MPIDVIRNLGVHCIRFATIDEPMQAVRALAASIIDTLPACKQYEQYCLANFNLQYLTDNAYFATFDIVLTAKAKPSWC